MPVAINMPAPRQAQIGAVLEALQAAHEFYGIKQAKAAADMLAAKQDPNSAESEKARQEEGAVLDYLHGHKAINDQAYSSLHSSVFGSPTGPMQEGQTRQAPMSAMQLEKDPQMSPLLQLYRGQQQADAMGARFNGLNDTKKEMQQNTIHEQILGKLQKDPTLSKQLVQYQNLDNALSLITKSDHITPQQFDEFQQSIRGNLGIKGNSGVDERSHTYLNSIGLNADRWTQMLSGAPASMSQNDPFLQHVKQLASIEQSNIENQTQKRMNALTGGNQWLYNQRPDLKAGLDQAVQSIGSQYASNNPPSEKSGGSPMPGTTAQAGTFAPHPQDSQAIQWAKQTLNQNPNDPRAIKILQMNGGGGQ